MKNIKVNIKEVVNRNLLIVREERLHNAIKPLLNIKEKDEFIKKYLTISANLIDEGFTLEEIENPLDQFKNLDFGGVLKGAIWSEVKEYAIKWLLEALGVSKPVSEQLGILLSDMNPVDLIRIFKNPQLCQTHMPHISDSIVEALVRFYGGKMVNAGEGSAATSLVGNIIGESIRKSNIGETITNITCKFIHR